MRLGWLLVCVCGVVWGMWSCSAPDCRENKPCPNGQQCVQGSCIVVDGKPTEPNESTVDAGGVEKKPEVEPEPEPDTGGLPKTYLWEKTKSPSSADLWGVAMPNARTGWVVGARGTILKTTNGGGSWKAQKSGVAETLRAVSFINGKQGWVVGDKGIVLMTKDAGANWKKLSSPVSDTLRSVHFLDEQNGYAVGDDFALLRTRNAGKSWQSTSSGLQINLNGVAFLKDRRTGVMVGSKGTILFTRDSAQQITTVVTGVTSTFWGVWFVSDKVAWAVGEFGLVLQSKNAGESWERKESGISSTLRGVRFANSSRGWIVGRNGVLLGTRDGGTVWTSESRSQLPDLHALGLFSEKAGVIVGKAGTILHLKGVQGQCEEKKVQECYTGPKETKGVGVCIAGTQTCEGGAWGPCLGEVKPADQETCFNEKDDNCDGKIDEECKGCKEGATQSCYSGSKETMGTGICRAGQQRCINQEWGACENEVLPKDETCNGLDDDCDGKLDNNFKNPPPCSSTLGICAKAFRRCVNKRWEACKEGDFGPDYEKNESKCDQKDNDCDGSVDEGCACPTDDKTVACYSGSPATNNVGECKPGVQTCTSGKWSVCTKEIRPSLEICADQKDNDCDGDVDEKTQYALSFNGRGSYVGVGVKTAFQLAKNFTVEGWFRPSRLGLQTPQALISMAQQGGFSLLLDPRRERGRVRFQIWPKNGQTYQGASGRYGGVWKSGEWAHVAGTFDGKVIRVWLNGKKLAERRASADTVAYTGGVPLLFGAEATVGGVAKEGSWYFLGRIAQVRISKVVRYTKDFTPDCFLKKDGDVLGLWWTQEGTGTTVKDETGSYPATCFRTSWRDSPRCPGYKAGGCRTP